jgi:hypothetical protein
MQRRKEEVNANEEPRRNARYGFDNLSRFRQILAVSAEASPGAHQHWRIARARRTVHLGSDT